VENYHYFSKTTTVCFIIIVLIVINIRHSHFSGDSVVFSRACTIAAVQTSYGNIFFFKEQQLGECLSSFFGSARRYVYVHV
jgi:hypothetical protein